MVWRPGGGGEGDPAHFTCADGGGGTAGILQVAQAPEAPFAL